MMKTLSKAPSRKSVPQKIAREQAMAREALSREALSREAMADLSLDCRIAVERTDENMFAHMLTAQRLELNPGDRVQILGEPVCAAHGERFLLKRRAIVKRAGFVTRFWMRFIAVFQITGLYEISFSDRREL